MWSCFPFEVLFFPLRIRFKEMWDKSITASRKQRFPISHSALTGGITFKLNRFPLLVLASNESKEMDLPWLVNNIIAHNRVCSNRSIGPTWGSVCACVRVCGGVRPQSLSDFKLPSLNRIKILHPADSFSLSFSPLFFLSSLLLLLTPSSSGAQDKRSCARGRRACGGWRVQLVQLILLRVRPWGRHSFHFLRYYQITIIKPSLLTGQPGPNRGLILTSFLWLLAEERRGGGDPTCWGTWRCLRIYSQMPTCNTCNKTHGHVSRRGRT